MTITLNTYAGLQKAYDHFNRELFDGKLPQCLITLAYHRNAYGYFRDQVFHGRKDVKRHSDEIALNPFTFAGRSDAEIMSTLVHEQVHLWQHHFGKPKKTHHDKQWAEKMESIGLMPSSTGAEGGKRTGRRVSHYIIKDGDYAKAYTKCKVIIDWAGLMIQDKKKVARRRTKYTCPECELNAYAKAEVSITCTDCDTLMEPE